MTEINKHGSLDGLLEREHASEPCEGGFVSNDDLRYLTDRIAELEADNKRLAKYAKGWHDGHKVGMERAAVIADKWELGLYAAEAIRKEIEK